MFFSFFKPWTAYVQGDQRSWLRDCNNIMNANQQLELSLRGTSPRRLRKPVPARLARAQWWFARMREAVGTAMDWNLDPTARSQPGFISEQKEIRA